MVSFRLKKDVLNSDHIREYADVNGGGDTEVGLLTIGLRAKIKV